MFRPRLLLLPFTLIYAVVVKVRNLLFDAGLLPSESYAIPVIAVGNLTLGGTGKTPMVEYLTRLLEPGLQLAILSRGYGRATKGTIIANPDASYTEIGDEPKQMQRKFKNIAICVAENRRDGMAKLLSCPRPPEVVIMDDGFQHRYVKPGLSIVLFDYNRPPWNDFCLPAGNLREPLEGVKRADIVIISKCPENLTQAEGDKMRERLGLLPRTRLFFTSILYGNPVPLERLESNSCLVQRLEETKSPLVALAGIGNPAPFFAMARKFHPQPITLRYRDHHQFSAADIKRLTSLSEKHKIAPLILTTEKDATRLHYTKEMPESLKNQVWYIPVEIEFLFNAKNSFDELITRYVRKI